MNMKNLGTLASFQLRQVGNVANYVVKDQKDGKLFSLKERQIILSQLVLCSH